MQYQTLMHDLLFKETFADPHNRRQLELFIAANGSSERDSVAKGDVLLMELNEWIKKYVADDETQEELNKWDIEIATNKGIELGKKEGLEQGKAERNIEIAKELLKMKLNDEDIAKATGLTSNEIMQLKEDK